MPASTPGGPVRDCCHPRAAHQHGTRAAYVSDRCRCPACRAANQAHASARRRAIAYGRWQPYVVDTAPVREHLQRLRDAGLGIDRIITLSGVGSGTVRDLLYGAGTTKPGRRLRTTTAQRLLDVQVCQSFPAPGALCDASETQHQLRELRAAGYAWVHLASLLGRDPASLRATLRRCRIRVRTATAVAQIHRRLFGLTVPVQGDVTPAGDVTSAGDVTPASPEDSAVGELGDIDEVAVEQAMQGRLVSLTLGEERSAIERLTRQGRSVRQIALLLHTSPRTVSRRRSTTKVA